MNIDDAVNHRFTAGIEMIQQLVTSKHPPRRSHEGLKKLVLVRCKLNRTVVKAHLALFQVQDKTAVRQNTFFCSRSQPSSSKNGLNARDEFTGTEWLHYIIICP